MATPSQVAKALVNPNELGDLVPKCVHEDSWPSRDMGPKYQEQLKEISHRTVAVRNRWKCDWLPMWPLSAANQEISADMAAFSNAAYYCAVHLSGGNVGVLRMDSGTGDCALFLRLKRADWFAWADKNKVPRSAGRAFTKRMDRELGKKMLMDARACKLGLFNVHHPSVLALLCTMSKHNWLNLADERTEPPGLPKVDKMCTFTLVALPPLPAEFEQCLGLLGHSAAFVKDNAGSDDDEVSLSTRNDAKPIDKVWGTISAGDQVIGSLAHLFEEGATVIHQLANPSLFAHGLANFNGAALTHGRFLDRMQRATNAAPLPPLYPGDETSYLDPSDDEEAAAAAAEAPATTAPAAAAAPKATTPAPRKQQQQQQPKQPKARAPPRKKKRGSDSDELSDSDESSGSGSDTSEEEDATSSSGDSDDSDGSEDGEGARPLRENASSSSPDSPSPTASRKRARQEFASAPAAAPDLNGDQALHSVLAEMAKPFCERVERLCNGRGIALFSEHNRLKADMRLLKEARTPVAFCAAMISIGTTLSDLQAERFSQSCHILVDREEAHRLRGLAAQSSQFAEAVHAVLSGPGGLGSALEE